MHSESVTIGGQAHTKPGNPTLLLIGTVELAVWGRASQVPNLYRTRLRPRLRVPESWRAPRHSKLYGVGPMGAHLVEFNYEASV
jgi:hypothetical protein